MIRDNRGEMAGFIIGCLLYIGLLVFMILVPIKWAWNGLMSASTTGGIVGYIVALIIFCILTIIVGTIGLMLPIIGAEIE